MTYNKTIQKIAKEKIVSETEVRTRIVEPIFQELGYSDTNRAEEWPVYYSTGSTTPSPKQADIVFFDSPDFNNYRSRDGVSWVKDHSLLVIELKKFAESMKIEGQAQFYAQWTRVPFYALSNGKELHVYRVEHFSKDELVFSSTIEDLAKNWTTLKKILSPIAVKTYIKKNKLRDEDLHNTDYSLYLEALEKRLEGSLAYPLPRTLSVTEAKNSLSLVFPLKSSIEEDALSYEAMSASSLLKNRKPTVVLAELGGGKTYLFELLAKELVTSNKNFDGNSRGIVPILLVAKAWHEDFNTLIDGIWAELKDYITGITQELIEEELKAGKYLLLVDGLDEVTKANAMLHSALIRLVRQRVIQIIVSCRSDKYHQELNEQFGTCTIAQLSPEQINNYASNLLGKPDSIFYQQLDPALKELVQRPLFLQMTVQLAKISPDSKLPKNKASLYNKYIEVILTDWQHHKSLPVLLVDQGTKEKVLAEYAERQFMKAGNDRVLNEIVLKYKSIYDPTTIRTELLASSLLNREARGPVFYHSSFQEYFYGLSLSYKADAELLKFISSHHTDERYADIFIFLGGFLTDVARQSLLLDYLEANNLYLYGRCLQARFSRNAQLQREWTPEKKGEYLAQLRSSYLRIIQNHFQLLLPFFAPWQGSSITDRNAQLIIEGNVDLDALKISYQFNLSPPTTPEKEFVRVTASMVQGFFIQPGGPGPENPVFPFLVDVFNDSTGHSYYHLPFKEWGIDSAREAALDKVRVELERFLKTPQVFVARDLVLSFERLNLEITTLAQTLIATLAVPTLDLSIEQPLEQLKQTLKYHLDMLVNATENELGSTIENIINEIERLAPSLEEYQTISASYLLPPSDKTFNTVSTDQKTNSWHQWSDKALLERIETFYYFFQQSYRYMVSNCFPTLKSYLPFYGVGPVRFYCTILKNENNENEPFVQVSWEPVANLEDGDFTPVVKLAEEMSILEPTEKINLAAKLRQLGRNPISYPKSNYVRRITKYLNTHQPILLMEVYEQLQEDFKTFFNKIGSI